MIPHIPGSSSSKRKGAIGNRHFGWSLTTIYESHAGTYFLFPLHSSLAFAVAAAAAVVVYD